MQFDQTIVNVKKWEVNYRNGKKAFEKGEYEEAEKQLRTALDEAEKFGSGDPRLGNIHNSLAEVYAKEEKFEESDTQYQKVIEIWENSLGASYSGFLDVFEKYSAVLDSLKRNEDAEKIRARAKAILDGQNKLNASVNQYTKSE